MGLELIVIKWLNGAAVLSSKLFLQMFNGISRPSHFLQSCHPRSVCCANNRVNSHTKACYDEKKLHSFLGAC